jgi:hypothetical protein
MVTATPFKQVHIVNDGKIQAVEPIIDFKPTMSKKTDKSSDAANITDTEFTPIIVVNAFIVIFILVKLIIKEKLFSKRKVKSKRVNSKKSIKKFLTRNLHKININSNI